MTGIELIANERQRQIDAEGWTAEHDSKHYSGEIIAAARSYAKVAQKQVCGLPTHQLPFFEWPWDDKWWKPSDNPVRNLVKAGALIAAEIDRLQRMTS